MLPRLQTVSLEGSIGPPSRGAEGASLEVINAKHENVKYLPGVKLPENVVAVPSVEDAARGADILVRAPRVASQRGRLQSYISNVLKFPIITKLRRARVKATHKRCGSATRSASIIVPTPIRCVSIRVL